MGRVRACDVHRGPPQGHPPSLNIRLYTAVEMAAATTQAGFSSISVFGNLDGGPYDLTATQMVAIARK